METSEKDFARRAWRATQKKKGRRKFSSPQNEREPTFLKSNEERYAEAVDAGLQPGQHAATSKGADLAQLLEETRHLDYSTLYRSRQLLDDEVRQALPDSVLADAEQVLTVDYAALEDSLNLLPLSEVLGIEEELLPSQPASAIPSSPRSAEDKVSQAAIRQMNDLKHAQVGAVAGKTRQATVATSARDITRNCSEGIESSMPFVHQGPDVKSSGNEASALPHLQALALGTTDEADAAAQLVDTSQSEFDREFEELLYSGSPRRTTQRQHAVEVRKQLHDGDGSVKPDETKTAKLQPEVTSVGQPSVDDLESWLDSL